jgi:putative membrane protein
MRKPFQQAAEEMNVAEERVLWNAEFNERVTTYWLLSGAIVLTMTVVGVVVLPIWFLVGGYVTRRYLQSYRCTLTNRSLKVARGWLVRVEKTVPLDRITDLGLVQGPIMRLFDIEALSVETAGQSSQGSLVQLAGIVDGRKFRDAVLKQRDLVVGSEEERSGQAAAEPRAAAAETNAPLLEQIRDTLLRIEEILSRRSS